MFDLSNVVFIHHENAGACAAAPVAGLPAIVGLGEIVTLIADYQKAAKAFVEALDDVARMEDAWSAAEPGGFLVPIFLDGAIGSRNGVDQCREFIAGAYAHNRKALGPLAQIAPEQAEKMRLALDEKEAENLALVDKLFAEEEEREEAFGLGPAKRRYKESLAAEERAALALCSFACRNLDEARVKAAAILASPMIMESSGSCYFEALLRSFAPTGAVLGEARS